jgi:hypothetical protein
MRTTTPVGHDHPLITAADRGDSRHMALTAPAPGRLALAVSDLAMSEAQQRMINRHHAANGRSRTLCEDLSEYLGWLQRPDDPQRVPEVLDTVRKKVAALADCVARLAMPLEHPHPGPLTTLAALVDALDAEVRLADLGDRTAQQRASAVATALVHGASTLEDKGAAE